MPAILSQQFRVLGQLFKMARYTRRSTKVGSVLSRSDDTWVEDETKKLFIAIKKYGYLDIENICKDVGTKSHDKVKIYMKKVTTLAIKQRQEQRRCTDPKACRKLKQLMSVKSKYKDELIELHKHQCKMIPLDYWIKRIKTVFSTYNNDMSVNLATAFLHISKFEDHAPPAECEGLDFKELYMCLYLLSQGLPPMKMSPQNSQFMIDTIEAVVSMIQITNKKGLDDFVGRLEVTKPLRTYKSKTKVKVNIVKKIEGVKGMNPFRLSFYHYERRNFSFQLNFGDWNKELIDVEGDEVITEEATKELMNEEANQDVLTGEVFIELITGEDINEEVIIGEVNEKDITDEVNNGDVITGEANKKVITDEVNNEDVITGEAKEEVPGEVINEQSLKK